MYILHTRAFDAKIASHLTSNLQFFSTMYLFGSRVRPLRHVFFLFCIFVLYVFIRRTYNRNIENLNSKVDEVELFIQDNTNRYEEKNHLEKKEESKSKEVFDVDEKFLQKMDKSGKCADYVEYSQKKHVPFSRGKRRFPYMRPAPKCRTFSSDAVERVIQDLQTRIEDPDLARLVENCLPNTLDTTILWHNIDENLKSKEDAEAFVVTGDIHAEWLRDAARQLSVYQPFIQHDERLKNLIRGAINTQSKYILTAPYCNAFHPPPPSGVRKGETAVDNVFPKPDWRQVFECKYELDSLASFLTLCNEFYQFSEGDISFMNDLWLKALQKLLVVVDRESKPSFHEDGRVTKFYYSFQRQTTIGSETLPLGGVGNPVNFGTGLVRSAFRPSDDATILQFFIPANIQLLTELTKLRTYFTEEAFPKHDIEYMVTHIDKYIQALTTGIQKYGVVQHPNFGKVYAYEVDGYGGAILMDDANLPSLLSIPEMGYADVDDEVYQNTRRMILSKEGNPYYLKGRRFEGIGGPHIGIYNAWPMSLLVRMRTSNDDDEVTRNLKLIMDHTAGLGLMHESVHVDSIEGRQYTRPWFAWCNSEFGKTILHLAKNKPHLIFKDSFKNTGYDLQSTLNTLKG